MIVHEKRYACGGCIACRINRAETWKTRLLHELPYWNESVYLTLTYSDEHLPKNASLKKNDLQSFIKLLRWHRKQPLKYYACGEYGSESNRPHYHLIIFGCGKEQKLFHTIWKKSELHTIKCGTVTPQSCRYVTGYIIDKLTGKAGEETYLNKEKPFTIQSQGLGSKWMEDNADKITQDIHENRQQHPRYYRKKLNEYARFTKGRSLSIDTENSIWIPDVPNQRKQRERNIEKKLALKPRNKI